MRDAGEQIREGLLRGGRVRKARAGIAIDRPREPSVEAVGQERHRTERLRAGARRLERIARHFAQHAHQRAFPGAARGAPVVATGQHPEREQTERPHVGLRSHAAAHLLGCHPERRADRRRIFRRRFGDDLGDPEIEQLHEHAQTLLA